MLAAVMVFSIVGIIPQDVSASQHSLPGKSGSVVISDAECSDAIKDFNWISYKAPQDGYLELKFSNNSTVLAAYGMSAYGYACLYDGGRKTLLSKEFYYDTESTSKSFVTEYYGVKKGKTYAIRIDSTGGVKISAKFTKLKSKFGTKKGKAVNVKKGAKGVTSVITAGTTGTQWYKFTLSKPSKLKVAVTPYLTGNLNIGIKGPGAGNSISSTISCRETIGNTIYPRYWGKTCYVINSGNVYLKKGTYYVQIKPASKTCNGYYKLIWK